MSQDPVRYQQQLDIALQACKAAEDVINHYFSMDFEVQTKSDASPVTIADIEAEKSIREILLTAFPEYGFFGEETGTTGAQSDFLWLVDPIDGTKSFVRGSPFFSTQIALMHGDELVVGVSNAPHFNGGCGETAAATRNGGASLNGAKVTVSAETELDQAFLSTGNLGSLAADKNGWSRFGDLVAEVARSRGYGDFSSYHQLSCGQADLVLESDVNILDIAALNVIVEEAGGVFTQLDGGPVSLETRDVLAAASPELHLRALQCLSACNT